MKKYIKIILFVFVITFTSCEKDNFDAPNALLKGQINYEGTPISVRSNSAEFELWQDGYALDEFIPVFIAQDGSYSVSLFDGEYKMVRKGGDPWLPQLNDTINIQVNGNTQYDVTVTPYFYIQNENFENVGNTINATFQINKVVEESNLQAINIVLGKSKLIDQNINDFSEEINLDQINLGSPSTVSIDIPDNLIGLEFLYIRIGVDSSSSNELIYTNVQRIDL